MPDRILHKRNLTSGNIPTTASLEVGELAINVADGKVHLRRSGSGNNDIVSLVTANTVTTGSITATSFTGSLFGTSSWASSATTSSYAIQALSSSYAIVALSSSIANTASYAVLAQSATSSSYAATSSYVNTLNQDVTISGSLAVIGNSVFYGSSSFLYITASQLAISSSFISVNIFEPLERFGGLKVYDSGSSNATASLAWDSQHNHWVYQNVSGSTYTGGMLLSGPRNTGSLGDEPNLTKWFIPRSDGGDHLDDSQIFTSGSTTIVTGSLTVTQGITGSLYGTSSWALNAQTASYVESAQTASYILNAVSASFAQTASYLLGYISPFPFSGSAQITGSLGVTGSFIIADGSNIVIDSVNRVLKDSSGINSISWNSRRLADTNATTSIDWDQKKLNDGSDVTSINWESRRQNDNTGVSAVDWGQRQLTDAVGSISTDWSSRIHYDSTTIGSINWEARQLLDSTETLVLDWNNKTLTASLHGTASWAESVTTSSYALTASFVNLLNQSVIITGSLTVGSGSIGVGENTLVIGPAPNGGIGEGGQILLSAVGGTYTSASMIDNYQNRFRILRGTNAGSDAEIASLNMSTGQLILNKYTGSGAFPGTAAANLAVDTSGNVITVTPGASSTATFNYGLSYAIANSQQLF